MEVEVYGMNHSPWVQAVLLALHEKGIEHTLRQIPPLEAFKQWGVLIPAVSIDGGPWEIESSQILVKLGLEPLSDQDLKAIHGAWRGVHHRSDNPLVFFAGFARDGDRSGSLFKQSVSNFLRSFMAFYGFTLISFVKWKLKPEDPENYGDQFLIWERALDSSGGPFLDGDAPGSRDMLLFGMVQCHSSIPTPALGPLRSDERLTSLRLWIASMQERFKGFPHLHSGRYFEPFPPQPEATGPVQCGIFYLGLLTMVMAFPVTVPLVFVLMSKVPR